MLKEEWLEVRAMEQLAFLSNVGSLAIFILDLVLSSRAIVSTPSSTTPPLAASNAYNTTICFCCYLI